MPLTLKERLDVPVRVGHFEGTGGTTLPPLYFHPVFEFQFFAAGRGHYFIKDTTYSIRKNSVLFIPPNQVHRYLPHPTSSVRRFNLMFCPSFVQNEPELVALLNQLHGHHHLAPSEKEATAMRFILEETEEEIRLEKAHWRELVLCNIEKFLIMLNRLKENRTDRGLTPPNPFIEPITAYVEAHFAENLSLQGVADKFGHSSFHISRTFKKHMGIGFKEYLIQHRIIEAKRLLETSPEKVAVIAHRVGFGDLSTFNDHFKTLTGYAPSSYRKLST